MAYLGVDNCPNSLVSCEELYIATALELIFQVPVFDTGLGLVAVFASTGKPILEKKTLPTQLALVRDLDPLGKKNQTTKTYQKNPSQNFKRDKRAQARKSGFATLFLAVIDFRWPLYLDPNGGGLWCSWCIDLSAKWFLALWFNFCFCFLPWLLFYLI